MKDGRVQGGLSCVCHNLQECNAMIDANVRVLGEGVGVTVLSPSERRGKGKEKGRVTGVRKGNGKRR